MNKYKHYFLDRSLNINKVLNTVKDGFTITDPLSEEPDTAIIQFKSSQKMNIVPFEDLIQIQEEQGSTMTYVITNVVEKIASQKPIIYFYILTLANRKVELTTKKIIPSFCVTNNTQSNLTLQDVYNRLRYNYPLETADNWESTRILQEQTIEGFNKPCKEIFQSKTYLGDAIENLFSQINATYRCYFSGSYALTKIDFNEREIINDVNWLNKEEESNGNDFVGSIDASLSNVLTSKNSYEHVVYYPSMNSFAQQRGISDDGATLSDSNRVFRVPYPIYELNTLQIGVPVKVEIRYKDSQESYSNCTLIQTKNDYLPYNVTNYTFESVTGSILKTPSKFRETLKLNYGELDRSKALFYDYQGTVISGFNNTFDLFGLNTVLGNIIQDIGSVDEKYRQSNGGIDYRGYLNGILVTGTTSALPYDSVPMYTYFYNVVRKSDVTYWSEYTFNIHYKTMLPLERYKLQKIDLTNINIDNNININQEHAVLDLSSVGENMFFTLNRLSDNKVTLCGKVKNASLVPQKGQKTSDNYVITEVETSYYKSYCEFKLTLVKNFTNISAYQQIDKEFRPFEISDKGIKSDLVYTEYIVFSSTKENITNNSMLKDETWLDYLFKTNTSIYEFAPAYALFKTDVIDYYVHVPVVKSILANTWNFHFEFTNQISAGNSITTVTNTLFRNEAVKYTDDYGEFSKFNFIMNLWGMDYFDQGTLRTFPKVSIDDYEIWKNDILNGGYSNLLLKVLGNEGIVSKTFNYKKDASEIFGFTYQVALVPKQSDINNIIVGTGLPKVGICGGSNRFDKVVCSTTKEYNIFNNSEGLGEENSNITVTLEKAYINEGDYDISNSTFTIKIAGDNLANYKSIGLCTNSGKLLLGINQINGSIPNEIYIYYRNKRI